VVLFDELLHPTKSHKSSKIIKMLPSLYGM
jgi:hypothetical protein